MKRWNEVVGIDCSEKGFKICQVHFQQKHILKSSLSGKLRLHPNALPCFHIAKCDDTNSQSSDTNDKSMRQQLLNIEIVDYRNVEEEGAQNDNQDIEKKNIIVFEVKPESAEIFEEDSKKCKNLVDEVINSVVNEMKDIEAVESKLSSLADPVQFFLTSNQMSEACTRNSLVPENNRKTKPLNTDKKKVPSRCKVPDCRESGSVFVIPETVRRSTSLLKAWEKALDMDCSIQGVKVCEYHFEEKHILKAQSGRLRLHPKAFPCYNLPQRDDS